MKKSTIIAIIVFVTILIIFTSIYFISKNLNKDKYYCIDYETDTTYTFKTEEEMHATCDKFNGVEDDKILESSKIYNDLISYKDDSFNFYPYVDSNKKLAIIITIIDCNSPTTAKEKAIKWFSNHSYNINDYQVDYEYPCES